MEVRHSIKSIFCCKFIHCYELDLRMPHWMPSISIELHSMTWTTDKVTYMVLITSNNWYHIDPVIAAILRELVHRLLIALKAMKVNNNKYRMEKYTIKLHKCAVRWMYLLNPFFVQTPKPWLGPTFELHHCYGPTKWNVLALIPCVTISHIHAHKMMLLSIHQ